MWVWTLEIAGALAAGVVLGLFYFGGLWWTVRRVMKSPRPHVLILASFVIRMLATLAALWLLLQVHWVLAVVAVAVMIVTRVVLTAKLGKLPVAAAKSEDGVDDGR
ncbi:MAG TPA: ATP synthase subunit I [Planctomycetota bacterium]|nr:ATP synthase subunit I [Planctomycetota bacterium]